MKISLESLLKESKRAILLGVGGGGDVVGTIPTARLLELFGIKCVLGGLPWERSVYDPVPGPRTFNEVKNANMLCDTVWLANKDTKTTGGVRFAESGIAEIYGKEVLLVDITKGVLGVIEGLKKTLLVLKADLLVGIDVGGDSLAFGNEEGLRSPLADSIMLASFFALRKEVKTLWGVLGYGSDGELTGKEIGNALSFVAKEGGLLGAWGLTPEVVEELDMVTSKVQTEASRIPIDCAKGEAGEKFIRGSTRKVLLSPMSTITFYLSPQVIYEKVSKPARSVIETKSLEEANEALHSIGLYTELDYERDKEKERF